MTDGLIRDFRKGLRELERHVELALLSQTKCCGVTPAQCHLLLEAEYAGEASVGDLAAALELDASTLSRTVDSLVRAGFLARREDPANRRRQLICLTESGLGKVDYINSLCNRYYEGLLASLSADEAETLLATLPLFVKAMRAWRFSGESEACCQESGKVKR